MSGFWIRCILNWLQSNCLPRAMPYFSPKVSPPPPIYLKSWSFAGSTVLGGCGGSSWQMCVTGGSAFESCRLALIPIPFSLIPKIWVCYYTRSATMDRATLDTMPSLPLNSETKSIFLSLRASVHCFIAIMETNTSRNHWTLVLMIEIMLIKNHWRLSG